MSDVHPLDFAALNKGDVVPQEHIERIFNLSYNRDPERFRLAMLQLRKQIEERRKDLLVRCKGTRLEILTDHQAEDHTVDRYGKLVAAQLRTTQNRARIDRSGFDELEIKKAESWDRAMTGQALSAQKAVAAERRNQLWLEQGSRKP